MLSKQRLIYLCTIIIIFFTTVNITHDVQANRSIQEQLLVDIEEIIEWKKYDVGIQKDEPLFRSSFVEQAGKSSGDWFPIGIGRIGYPDDYDAYLAVIAEEVAKRYRTEHKLSEAKATEWHRISLAILALGGDPRRIAKDEKGEWIDLIEDGTYNRGKVASLGLQGLNGWTWGLITLDSLQYRIPNDIETDRVYIIERILENQLDDGGFSLQGDISDPDMTAMTLQALSPYYNDEKTYTYTQIHTGQQVTKKVRDVIDEALDTLSKMQQDNGSFASLGIENTESIVQVIVALTSLGIDPLMDKRFIKNGKTVLDALKQFKHKDGGFIHSKTYEATNPTAKPDEVNSMATEQALYGLVSLYRFYEEGRALYDFREELDEDIKKEIDDLKYAIDDLPNPLTKKDEEKVSSLFERYKQLPIGERRYVYNYHVLSAALDELQIKNDAAFISEHIGETEVGEGIVTYYFTGEGQRKSKEFTQEDIARYKALSEPLTTEDYTEVTALLDKLKRANNRQDYESIYSDLRKKKEQIELIQADIDALNEMIVDELFPIEQLTFRDKDKVEAIIERYKQLSPEDQEKIVNYEDVERAYTKVKTNFRHIVLTASVAIILTILVVVWIVYRKRKIRAKHLQEVEE